MLRAALPAPALQLQNAIIRTICVFWFAAKAMSWPAWLADNRDFHVISAFDFLSGIPPIVHTLLFGVSALAIAMLFAFPKQKWLSVLLFCTEIFSCLLDVARWQPWEYQYLFIIFILLISRNQPGRFTHAVSFIIVSVYIFSGLHKLNGGFLHTIWDNMILRGFFGLSGKTITGCKLHYAGLLLPAIETGVGLALLFFRNKKLPAILLIAMHILLLVFLGPFGINYNPIVWPWNVAMILLLYLLFIKKVSLFPTSLLPKQNILILLFWGILPIFSFFGLWENNFSSALYSGKTKNLVICFEDQDDAAKFPSGLKLDKYNICKGGELLHLQKWAYNELGLPPYPEAWYYRKVAEKWRMQNPDTPVRFYIYSYPYKQFEEIE